VDRLNLEDADMSRLLESAIKRGTEGTKFRALESYVSGAVVYSDNFDRANTTTVDVGGAGLGAEWTGTSWRISSNTAVRDASGPNDFVVFQHDLATLDMWAEADVTPNGAYGIVNVRNAASVFGTCYMGFFNPANLNYEIGITVANSYSTVAQGGSGANVAHKLRLEAQGTALRLYVDDVLTLSTTNGVINSTDFPNNRYAGMNSTTGPVYDNYRCGALPYTP
jgi:hypothetical protein